MTHPAVERAKQIVASCEWSGDMRVNMTTIIGAGRVLAKRLDEMETSASEADRRIQIAINALRQAWKDLHEWRQLAERQRELLPHNHPVCPTQAGVDATKQRIEEIGNALKQLRDKE